MIPLRDTLPSERFPIVNYSFIALCSLAFYFEFTAGSDVGTIIDAYALVPVRFFEVAERSGFHNLVLYIPFVSSTFLHAGILHFLGNMLFLWIFGDNVEDRLGHVGYAVFYLAGGVAAGVAHVVANPGSMIPTVGASGSIAAVMGAYMLMYPRAQIESLVIIFIFIRVISVPAGIYLLLWFALQLYQGTGSLAADTNQGGVAWWAHAGGFIFGATTVVLLGASKRRRRRR
jgi:membrane associated rhomboid family serine protease